MTISTFFGSLAGGSSGAGYQGIPKDEFDTTPSNRLRFNVTTLWQHRRARAGFFCVVALVVLSVVANLGLVGLNLLPRQ